MKNFIICWDCNLGGVFEVTANNAEEARQILVQRIQSGEYTRDDLDVAEERVYEYGEINNR